MNVELEEGNARKEGDGIQVEICYNDGRCQNNNVDTQFECKSEVLSENEEECMDKDQMTSNFVETAIKEEYSDPKGTTEDESMAVEALRQLGGMFENVSASNPQPVPFRQHICNICGESFERKTDLGNHIVCHQVDRPHACRICGNLFRRKADLQNHMVCHQVERPHRCPQCGADFQRPSSLTNHMKIHTYSPGRALISSGSAIPSAVRTLQNFHGFSSPPSAPASPPLLPQTTATTQSNQTVTNKLSEIQVPSYNGWDVNYSYNRGTDGNALSRSQTLEIPVTSDNNESHYGSVTPKHYSQISNISENVSQFSYEENSESIQNLREQSNIPAIKSIQTLTEQQDIPVVESVQNLQEQQSSPSQSNTEAQLSCNASSYATVTKNNSISFNSEGYEEAAVKVETLPYVPPVECPPTEETYSCVVRHEAKPPVDLNRRPHVCRHCGLGFSRGKALESHERLHQDHWGSPVECDKCEEMFPEDISLQQHRETCVGKTRNIVNQRQQHHEAVQQTQQQAGRYMGASSCPVVPNVNSSQPAKIGKHACTECEKRFTTKQKLFRHMWIHRKRPHVCEICGVSLADRGALDEHRRMQHPGDTPFTCNECGKSFASRQGLWEHGRVHSGNGTPGSSPFLCQRCGKCFASRQGHLIHMRTHTGERPYGCRFCWKAFRDGGTLRKHERIHTGERPHACPLCPRAFNQKVVLREHVRWVHAARNSDGCQLCGYMVGDREALCAHIVKHSDQLAAAAKAAKGKQEHVKTAEAQDGTSRTNCPETPPVLSQECYNTSNYAFISNEGVTSEAPDSNMNNKVIPDIKREYCCDMCGESFKERIELLNHVRIHI
ncbi:zinc finger protein 420-like [Periplaneta americana]|uniref:zinc finger protein 420-like n=1 Tax=Periplaneta americana TaxID=6978 RepID=UPI0037E8731E